MRIAEGDRSQITRFLYALRDYQLGTNKNFGTSTYFVKADKELLQTQTNKIFKLDHVFYDYTMDKYFTDVIFYVRNQVSEAEVKNIMDLSKLLLSSLSLGTFKKEDKQLLVYIKELKMIIGVAFKNNEDYDKYSKFMNQENKIKLYHNSNRKVFFIHGTISNNERWKEQPLMKKILLMIANTDQYDDEFNWDASLTNNVFDRNKAANDLVDWIDKRSSGISDIILIGHSHGGNVAIQIINSLVAKGKKVSLMTIDAPAYNNIEITGEEYTRLHFSECNMATSSIITAPTMPVYICKELENPVNTKVSYHLHLWNKKDRVAGGLAGDDYYKNKITKNIEIFVSKEFNNVEWIDAHSFDSYRPQLIYELIKNNTIPKIP